MRRKWILLALVVVMLAGLVPNQPAAAEDPPDIFIVGIGPQLVYTQGEMDVLTYQVITDSSEDIPMVVVDIATDEPATWAFTAPSVPANSDQPLHINTTHLAPGTHQAWLVAGPIHSDLMSIRTFTIEVLPRSNVPELLLVDALNDVIVGPLTDGMLIDLGDDLGHNQINIQAEAPGAGEVTFVLYGPRYAARTDANPPIFTLKATNSDNSDYYGLWIYPGTYTLFITGLFDKPEMAVQFHVQW